MHIFELMKSLQARSVLEFGLISAALFFFMVVFKPFNFDSGSNEALTYLYLFLECVVIFFCQLITELVVNVCFKMPNDYSRDIRYQRKRLLLFFLILLPILTVFIGEFWCLIRYGWKHLDYFWIEDQGKFTLKWFLHQLMENAYVCVLVFAYMLILTNKRMKDHRIRELEAMNSMLEQAREEALPEEEGQIRRVTLRGEGKDTLELNPGEILFIESVANYVEIWYFEDGELRQKRMRSTLKAMEQSLAEYSYFVHCHRAFMVNINYITHIEGNAAGCQIQMMSIQKCIPVSKANIDSLRNALAK